MPSFCGVPPVANVVDAPLGVFHEADDQVDASTVAAVSRTATEDHLGLSIRRAELPFGEAEWGEHRVQRVRNDVQLGVVGWQRDWPACPRPLAGSPFVVEIAGTRGRLGGETGRRRTPVASHVGCRSYQSGWDGIAMRPSHSYPHRAGSWSLGWMLGHNSTSPSAMTLAQHRARKGHRIVARGTVSDLVAEQRR